MTDKPEDIPQDVWDVAEKWLEGDDTCCFNASGFADDAIALIARAILAAKAEERQEILTLVSEYIWDDHALAQATDRGHACHHQSVEIFEAIRKRGEQNTTHHHANHRGGEEC